MSVAATPHHGYADAPPELPAGARILVVALRRIGDVLLTTPLIRSLRRAWPDARIEALVFADTAGILDGNPDLDAVVTMSPRPTLGQSAALVGRLFKRYHLAVSTQSGDRPTFFALLAGRRHVGPVAVGPRGTLRRWALDRSVTDGGRLHRVEDNLRLVDALGIPRVAEVVGPRMTTPDKIAPGRPYAVLHAAPMFRYKQWTHEGWVSLAGFLAQRGLTVVVTGGPQPAEQRYLDGLWRECRDVVRLDGTLTWREVAGLLAGAEVYVGPDTSVTHLAAASGCPTVALFGPTDPRLWGPWPAPGLMQPWVAAAALQQRGNVWLVQNPLSCVPCQQEGCEHRLDSHSRCLDELKPEAVFAAVEQALTRPVDGGAADQTSVWMASDLTSRPG